MVQFCRALSVFNLLGATILYMIGPSVDAIFPAVMGVAFLMWANTFQRDEEGQP